MKKRNLNIILVTFIIIFTIVLFCIIDFMNHFNKKNDTKRNSSINNNEECCKGCMCGDTIELLKNTETAWNLTEVNDNGEYVSDGHSFMNFHGTGKDRFAFFKNAIDGSTISEVRGEFSINKKNEIILIPDDNKNSKITCKLGTEKDLIAVMHCDNNFGTFTLQKQGTIELPSIIKDTVSKTKTIIVRNYTSRSEERRVGKEC